MAFGNQDSTGEERRRVVDLIDYAREEGEIDLRQLREWVESGVTVAELKDA